MTTPTNHGPEQPMTFAPAASLGWLTPLALVGLFAYSAAQRFTTQMSASRMVTVVILIGLALWMGAIAVEFRRLSYQLDPHTITLRYGALQHYHIDRSQLVRIVRKDLRFSPWASVRFPGLALYNVAYRGEGTLRMCASRSHRDVLILETRDGERYGCTPADPEAFIAAIDAPYLDARSDAEGPTTAHLSGH